MITLASVRSEILVHIAHDTTVLSIYASGMDGHIRLCATWICLLVTQSGQNSNSSTIVVNYTQH